MTQPMPQVGKTGFLAGVTRFMVRSYAGNPSVY
jgi:hypothetical protein